MELGVQQRLETVPNISKKQNRPPVAVRKLRQEVVFSSMGMWKTRKRFDQADGALSQPNIPDTLRVSAEAARRGTIHRLKDAAEIDG